MKKKSLKIGLALVSTLALFTVASCGAKVSKSQTTEESSSQVSSDVASSRAKSSSSKTSVSSDTTSKETSSATSAGSSTSVAQSTVEVSSVASAGSSTSVAQSTVEVSSAASVSSSTSKASSNASSSASVASSSAVASSSTSSSTAQSSEENISDMEFNDATLDYTGNNLSIAVNNVPKGVEVTYTNNNQRIPGIYTVTASFNDTTGKYGDIPNMTATLTIRYLYNEVSFICDQDTTTLVPIAGLDNEIVNLANLELTIDSNKYTLKNISKDYFSNNTTTKELYLPSTIETIEASAFSGCEALEKLSLPFASTNANLDTSFGILFGNTEYNNSYAVKQTEDFSTNSIETYYFPNSLKTVEVTGNTLRVDNFQNITSIKEVSCPNVTVIPNFAFYGCTSLEKVAADKASSIGSKAFYNCKALTDCNAIKNATTISSYAFYNCTSLANVELNSELTKLNEYVFYGCSSLTTLDVSKVEEFYTYSLAYTGLTEIRFSDSTNTIENSVLAGSVSITKLRLPFTGSSDSTDITYPNRPVGAIFGTTKVTGGYAAVQYIRSSTFAEYSEKTYYIPKKLTTIELGDTSVIQGFEFMNMTSLTTLVFDTSKEYQIAEYAFYNCSSLNTTIQNYASIINTRAFEGCAELPNFVTNTSLSYLGDLAFYGSGIENVTINSKNFTTLRSDVFNGCTNLLTVDLSNSVLTKISQQAFASCSSLNSVLFPKTLEAINERAFSGCTSLKIVDLSETVVSSIGNNAFYKGTGRTIYLSKTTNLTTIGTNNYSYYVYVYTAEQAALTSGFTTTKYVVAIEAVSGITDESYIGTYYTLESSDSTANTYTKITS
ncbi:MAG: leucine-rich repeat domain-containing protein [Acholeplasmatales bacterium]|nr:leucine-rich repeat domain-containing protein [Acholeplasmatales bacterium]